MSLGYKVPPKQLMEVYQRVQKINSRFMPHDGQKKILTAVFKEGKKRIIIPAGRSFGKTMICEYIALRRAMYPKQSVYIIGPTRKQQRNIIWEDPTTSLFSLIPEGLPHHFIDTKSRIEFPWGSSIVIDGSEEAQSYRGVPYDLMILDECRDQDARFYDASYPNLSKKDGTLIMISSLHEDENNWFMKKLAEAKEDPDWFYYRASSWENPHIKEWLTNEQKKYIKRGETVEWQLEYEAVYVKGGKRSIFPMLSEKKHTRPHDWIMSYIERDRSQLEYYTVFDPGYNSVFAVLFIAYNRFTSQLFFLDELYVTDRNVCSSRNVWQMAMTKESELYPPHANIQRVYDEAATGFERDIALEFGVGMSKTEKSKGDKEEDLSMMRDFLTSEDKFIMSDRCKKAYWEMSNYQTDKDGKPQETNDHLLDCARYSFRHGHFSLNQQATMPTEEDRRYKFKDKELDLEVGYDNTIELDEDNAFEGWIN